MDPSGDDVDQFELIEQKGPWPFTSRRAYRRPDGSLVVRESRHCEVAWKFTGAHWTPRAGVRYSAFSKSFDPLFYGFSTGYGTWFQGEVAGNYAGPFNSNAAITHLHLRGHPNKRWTLGALFYDFRTDDKDVGNLDGIELDLFLTWTKNDITVSPLLGFYKPDEFAVDGGTQLGDDDTNLYVQIVVALSF